MTQSPTGIEERHYGNVRVLLAPLPAASTRREAELEAERMLLPGLTIRHNADGAPSVEGSDEAISISHSRTHIAIAIGGAAPLGIDIETPRAQLRAVAPRVLSADELRVYGTTTDGLLRAWTLKEALYKAALTPGPDFRRDIRLPLDLTKKEATVMLPGGGTKSFVILAAEAAAGGFLSLVLGLGSKA